MVILYLYLTVKLIQVHSFSLPESYNNKLEENVKKSSDNYENNDYNKLIKLIKSTTYNSQVYKPNLEVTLKKIVTKASIKDKRSKVFSFRTKTKGTGFITRVPIVKHSIIQDNDSPENYSYDQMFYEYIEDAKKLADLNDTYHPKTQGETETGFVHSLKKLFTFDITKQNCTDKEMRNIGLRSVYCIVLNYRNGRESTKTAAARLWRIMKIWFLVYLVVAIPLWCTKGWCCCCFNCKFFKPRHTIEEAKRYLITNPPGVLKTSNGDMRYEPTESEIDAYERFDNILKAL